MELAARAVHLLQQLLRIRTVNPPGGERPVQELLAAELQQAGFEVTLTGRTAERPNLVARLRGQAPGPVLGLLSHVDTVLADAEDWRHDPWSGVIDAGDVWGRGAQDMKSQTAAEVAAAIDLAASGWRPARGDLLVIAVVDEERGGEEGAIWLCEHEPELVRCDWLLNEGAGTAIDHAGRRYFGVCTAEKGVFRFTLTVRGRPGHASMPGVADNPVLRLAPLLAALGAAAPGLDLTEAPERLFSVLGVSGLDELRSADPRLAAYVEPMVSVTVAPTVLEASPMINVVPAAARIRVDCRTPPGHGRETVERRVGEILAGAGVDYELTFDEEVVGNGSPADSPLMDALGRWLAAEEPGGTLLPFLLPAYTDSRTFRDAFPDCVAYGFFPQRERTIDEAWPLVHGIDERIAVADLGFAARCYRAVARDLLG